VERQVVEDEQVVAVEGQAAGDSRSPADTVGVGAAAAETAGTGAAEEESAGGSERRSAGDHTT
jgi:hypothetical protein